MEQRTGRELRQSTRVRRVQPVRFRAAGSTDMPTRKTVSANVSRGGMLLVSRTDSFPPSGTWIDLVPQSANGALMDDRDISGRIVYTRISPENSLAFAGLEFLNGLDERSAHAFGLVSGEDTVLDALNTLQELEKACRTGSPRTSVSPKPISESAPMVIDQLGGAFDLARAQFLSATESFLRSWAKETVIENVIEHHAVSLNKGAEGLGTLKSDLRTLLDSYPSMVDEMLNARERRPRDSDSRSPLRETTSYYDAENDNPAPWIAEALRNLMGSAGELLAKHGYEVHLHGSDWTNGSTESSAFRYRGSFTLPEELTTALMHLDELANRLSDSAVQWANSEEDRVRMEARRLWDES